MHFYTSYNLIIGSELPLPELTSLDGKPGGTPDISIHLGEINNNGLADGEQLGPFLWVNPSSLWLQVPHVAGFWSLAAIRL